MHKPRHLRAALGLYRHDKSAVSYGNDRLLQIFLDGFRVYHPVQLVPDFAALGPFLLSDVVKSRRGMVAYFLLAYYSRSDSVLKIFVGKKDRKVGQQSFALGTMIIPPLAERTNGPQHRGNAKQFSRRKASPRLCPRKLAAYVDRPRK